MTPQRTSLLAAGALLCVALTGVTHAGAAATDIMEQRGAILYGSEDWASTGWSVTSSDDGDTIAVSTPWRSSGGTVNGEVQVFDWDGTAWVQRGLGIVGPADEMLSGWSIDLDASGDVVAVGASSTAAGKGQVSVYAWNGSAWAQKGSAIDGEAASDEFGRTVALSSDGLTLAAGAAYHDGTGENAGRTRVFSWSGTDWVAKGSAIDGEAAGDLASWSLDMSDDGNRIAIGAPGNDGAASGAGHVRVYSWTSGAWQQTGSDLDGAAGGDDFGGSLSLSGDGTTLVVGATGNDSAFDNAGATAVYTWNGSAWAQKGSTITDDAAGSNSGKAVAIDSTGTMIATASPYYGSTDSFFGRVRLLDWNGTDWVQRTQTLSGDESNAGFGSALAMDSDGSVVVAGSPFANGRANGVGSATVFALVLPDPPPSTDPVTLPGTGSSSTSLAVLAALFVGVGLVVARTRRA